MAAYSVADIPFSIAKASTLTRFIWPMLLTMPFSHFVTKGMEEQINRTKRMNAMALDFTYYSQHMSQTGALSPGQQNFLAGSLIGSMDYRYQFFSPDQQMRIMKIGLANNLLDSKSQMGQINKGDIQQFKANYEELRKTTEEIVKMMNTTIEGGMAMIKNFKDMGFKVRDIKQQIAATKGLGELAGIGQQNMAMVAQAGAQNVQGTMFPSIFGAKLYQQNAATAALMARGSIASQYTVDRAGGPAQAGATLANMQMNLWQSGFGTKFLAYAMDKMGSLNEERFRRVISGQLSPFEISSGAAQSGYNMGLNRVMFPFFEQNALRAIAEQPNAGQINAMAIQSMFDAWRRRLPGNIMQQAAAFARQRGGTIDDQRLFMENLLANKGFGLQYGAQRVAELEGMNYTPIPRYGPFELTIRQGLHEAETWGETTGAGIIDFTRTAYRNLIERPIGGAVARTTGTINEMLVASGLRSPYSVIDKTFRLNKGLGDYKTGLSEMYGISTQPGVDLARGLLAISKGQTVDRLIPASNVNVDLQYIENKDQLKYLMSKITSALYQGTAKRLYLEKDIATGFRLQSKNANTYTAEYWAGVLDNLKKRNPNSFFEAEISKSQAAINDLQTNKARYISGFQQQGGYVENQSIAEVTQNYAPITVTPTERWQATLTQEQNKLKYYQQQQMKFVGADLSDFNAPITNIDKYNTEIREKNRLLRGLLTKPMGWGELGKTTTYLNELSRREAQYTLADLNRPNIRVTSKWDFIANQYKAFFLGNEAAGELKRLMGQYHYDRSEEGIQNLMEAIRRGEIIKSEEPSMLGKYVDIRKTFEPVINRLAGFDFTGNYIQAMNNRDIGGSVNKAAALVNAYYQAGKGFVPKTFYTQMYSAVTTGGKTYEDFIANVEKQNKTRGYLETMFGLSQSGGITQQKLASWKDPASGLANFVNFMEQSSNIQAQLKSINYYEDQAVKTITKYMGDPGSYQGRTALKVSLGQDQKDIVLNNNNVQQVLSLIQAKLGLQGGALPDGKGMTPTLNPPKLNYWNNNWMATM
jgi:hypothetical protein